MLQHTLSLYLSPSSPLYCHFRSFVMKHGVFLVRNYEKMKARQAFLLREGAREQENEREEDKESGQQSESTGLGEDPSIKSGLGVCVVVGDMCMCVCICYFFLLASYS